MRSQKGNVEKLIREWAKKEGVDLTDTRFYTPAQWRERGEQYCNGKNEVCVVSTEGGLNHALNMYNGCKQFDSFLNMLERNGYWFEMGTSWYFGVYLI